MTYVDRALLTEETIELRPRFSRFAAYGAPLVEFAAVVGAWSIARAVILGPLTPESPEIRKWMLWAYFAGLAIFAARFGWRMVVRFAHLVFAELAVTNRRFMEKEGILDIRFFATDLEKIQRVEIAQPLLGRIFDYGDITIVTLGEVTHTTRAVKAPIALQQALHKRMTSAAPGPRAEAFPPLAADGA